MKKIQIIGFATALCVLLPLSASAAQFMVDKETSLSSGETSNGNLYMLGSTVSDSGAVHGDFVAAGGTLLVNGAVSNDVLAAGGNISILGDVGGDVRIGGGNILIQGKIAGDAIIGGGQITVGGPGIGGDVAIGGGSVTLNAPVNGSVRIAGGQVTIDAPIKGSVQIKADKVTLGPKAVISGDLSYTATGEATMQSGAVVHGKTDFTKRESTSTKNAAPVALGAILTFALLAKLLMSLVGAFLFLWIFPGYAKELATSFGTKPLENLGRGFVFFIVLPISAILLLVTVVGIPLGFLALFAFAGLLIFASLVAPVAIGSLVHKWIWKPAEYQVDWKTILLGVAIFFLLTFVPFIGWIIKFCAILITLGVAVQIKWSLTKSLR